MEDGGEKPRVDSNYCRSLATVSNYCRCLVLGVYHPHCGADEDIGISEKN